jgi:AAA domain-containing protein
LCFGELSRRVIDRPVEAEPPDGRFRGVIAHEREPVSLQIVELPTTEDHPTPWGPEAESDARLKDWTVLHGPELAQQLPPLSYLVESIGLVDGGGAPHLMVGYGFSGKTLACQSLALSLAAGRSVWGVHLTVPHRVVHVDLEQGDRLTRRRYQRLALGMSLDLSELGDAIAVVVMPPLRLTDDCRSRWVELMSGRDLLIVDSLRVASGAEDENSSQIRAGLDLLGNISEETKCRALVIHHARKPSEQPGASTDPAHAIRGSSAIYDAGDSVYILGAKSGEPIHVRHVKARSHGEPVEDWALVISDVEDEGNPKAGVRVQIHGSEVINEAREKTRRARNEAQRRAEQERVLASVIERPGLNARELRSVTGMNGDRFMSAVVELHGTGKLEIREERNGRSFSARHYAR